MQVKLTFLIILLILIVCSLNYMFMDTLYYRNGSLNVDNFKKIEYPKNIRVAICYSGQLRDGYYQILNLQKYFLIEPFDADVFCYFEDTDDSIKEDVNKILKPKDIYYEPKEPSNSKTPKRINNIGYGTICMFKKMYLVNEMKKKYEKSNRFEYDYVIRIRPDIVVKEYLPKYIFSDHNNLYIPTDKLGYTLDSNFCGDWLAVGKNNLMNIYFNIYNYVINDKNNLCGIPEKVLGKYLKKNKINCKLLFDFYDYPLSIYRFKLDSLDNFISLVSYGISCQKTVFTSSC